MKRRGGMPCEKMGRPGSCASPFSGRGIPVILSALVLAAVLFVLSFVYASAFSRFFDRVLAWLGCRFFKKSTKEDRNEDHQADV